MYADIFFIVFILLGYYAGWRRGFLPSLVSFIVILVVVILGIQWLKSPMLPPENVGWLAYCKQIEPNLLFIILCLLLVITNKMAIALCCALLQDDKPSSFGNKFMGSIMGLLKSTLLLSTVLCLSDLLYLKNMVGFFSEGCLTVYIKPLLPQVLDWLASLLPMVEPLVKNHTKLAV